MGVDDVAETDDLGRDVPDEVLGIAKPIPGARPPSSGSVAASVGIPITRPWRSASAPPELPGLIAALVWIISGSAMPFPSETP